MRFIRVEGRPDAVAVYIKYESITLRVTVRCKCSVGIVPHYEHTVECEDRDGLGDPRWIAAKNPPRDILAAALYMLATGT